MSTYRMTPARRAALERAQAASARKRRKGNKSRTSRLVNRRNLALVGSIGAIGATLVVTNTAGEIAADRYRADTEKIRREKLIDLRYEALLAKKRREYQFLLRQTKTKKKT